MDVDEQIGALTQKMLRQKYYVVISTPVAKPEAFKPVLLEHLDYMIGLEKRGVVFASGPLADRAGPPTGRGLTVLRASDAAAARALAEADPFYINGVRTFELKEWTIMEGSLGLRVNLSDQSVEVT